MKTKHEDETCLIMNMIENVSWNKEINKREKKLDVDRYWLNLLGENGYIALMYIMDADRNESLWVSGHVRSIDYNTKHSLKIGEGERELYSYVNKVIEDKLKNLDRYCYTPSGKFLAIQGRDILCKTHAEWKKQLFD